MRHVPVAVTRFVDDRVVLAEAAGGDQAQHQPPLPRWQAAKVLGPGQLQLRERRWRQVGPAAWCGEAGLAVGDGDPSSDGVSTGAEPLSRRCDRTTGEHLWRDCGLRSLLNLQPPAGDAKAAVLGASDP